MQLAEDCSSSCPSIEIGEFGILLQNRLKKNNSTSWQAIELFNNLHSSNFSKILAELLFFTLMQLSSVDCPGIPLGTTRLRVE